MTRRSRKTPTAKHGAHTPGVRLVGPVETAAERARRRAREDAETAAKGGAP